MLGLSDAGRQPVYNLSLATEHSFVLADTGAIVHNCDALRYLVMSRSRSAKSQMKKHKTYDQRVSDRVTGSVSGRRKVHDVLGRI